MKQTKISKAYQTVEDVDALAGSFARNKKQVSSVKHMKATARRGMAKAGAAGLGVKKWSL